jgi:hypothetical protein
MPKDTQAYKKKVLAIVQTADEHMLQESGNPVYLKMKTELDLFR